jgi:mycothiol system anti-sigma-R factor
MVDCGWNCEETLKEVERFLDGELEPEAQGRVSHHLSDCNPCTERADFRRHLKDMVQSKCAEREVPAGLQERIRQLIVSLDAPDR